MARVRHSTPSGHGEVLTEPRFEVWAELAEQNSATAARWEFEVGGVAAPTLRRQARSETLASAGAYSKRIGIAVAESGLEPDLLVMTGHQPELYHPGIWVKDFLLQRLADESGAAAVDLVVDTDAFERVELRTPCLGANVGRCAAVLATAGEERCYACSAVPAIADVEDFRRKGAEALSTLPAPALGRHFSAFCDMLVESIECADDLGQALTGARRRYEASAGTDYLELGVSFQARTAAFRRFAASLCVDAERFATIYNAELEAYRARTGTRSSAQPFPALKISEATIELPLWVIRHDRRLPVSIARDGRALVVGGVVLCELPGDTDGAIAAIEDAGLLLVPRAVTLTMFNRMFVADLFIHGVGGGRYDRVTDAIVRSYYGVEALAFAVASMTLYLPLGAHVVRDEEITELEQRLQRLEHNPDQLLGDVEFENAAEREEAGALVAEKCALVTGIAEPGADKKAIGARIRTVNKRLGEIMRPVADETRRALVSLIAQREAADVLSDRTYPFCLWSPLEVVDKVR